MGVNLSYKQRIFTRNVGRLIEWAYANGYELTFGETYRTPEQAAANAVAGIGIANTLHSVRLAIDLNLFKDAQYLSSSEAHRPLGEYWKSLHPLNRWGGDFTKPDGGHYSMAHAGRQ